MMSGIRQGLSPVSLYFNPVTIDRAGTAGCRQADDGRYVASMIESICAALATGGLAGYDQGTNELRE